MGEAQPCTQAHTWNVEEGLVTLGKIPIMCIVSITDYIPYLDAFEITQKVAVGRSL